MILIDPIIYSPYLYNSIEEIAVPLSSTVGRRADFPNREVAYKEFLRIPFFSKWDRRVLKAYVDYAMVDEGSGGVRLKTHGFQVCAQPYHLPVLTHLSGSGSVCRETNPHGGVGAAPSARPQDRASVDHEWEGE